MHRNLQAASWTFSENTESIAPQVANISPTMWEQVFSTWNSWMGTNDTATNELPKESKSSQQQQQHNGKGEKDYAHRKMTIEGERQILEQDNKLTDSNNSDNMIPVREIVVRPNDQGSLCFQEDEMGSAIHDAIIAQYLEQPYVNGSRALVKTWSTNRGRSKTRSMLSPNSWGNKNQTYVAAERERRRNKALVRSLSRERSKRATTRSRSRSTSRQVNNGDEYTEEEREVVIYEPNVDGIRESSNVLVYHY
jgi:hypothetical protein